MSKFISQAEFWDNAQNIYTSNKKRDIGSIDMLPQYGDIKMNYFNTGSGINYSSFIANFEEDTIMEGMCSEDSSFLRFNIGNCMYMQEVERKSKITLDSNICWNGKENNGYKANMLYSKHKQFIMHSINFDNDLFNTLMLNNKSIEILKNENVSINFNNYINTKQKILLNNILESENLNGKLKEIYLESKILDLIYTSIKEGDTSSQNDIIYLSNQDIQSLKKAKKILLENISNPPSLKELAHKIATNEFKLKKGFKQLFGNTVYGLLQEHRLQEAKILLERNDINVSEAATLVGYKSIGHFSKIFKEKFGVLASDVMKSRKYYITY